MEKNGSGRVSEYVSSTAKVKKAAEDLKEDACAAGKKALHMYKYHVGL